MQRNWELSDYDAWIMLSLAFLISFLLHLLLFGTAPMVDCITAEMNLSHARFGFIFSSSMISLMILRIPWGFAIDRYGYLKILKISLPVIAVSAILRSYSSGYFTLITSQLILGVGLASVLPCLPLIVREWFPSRTGFATGVYVSGFAAGNGTALGLTPFLLQIFDWRSILLTYGIIALITGVLWWVLASSSIESGSKYELGHFKNLLGDRYTWVLILFMIACMGGYDTLATWMPEVADLKNLNESIALLLPLGFLMSGPLVGRLSDRIEDEGNLIMGFGFALLVSLVGIIAVPGLLSTIFIFSSGFFIMSVLTLTLKAPAQHDRLFPYAGKVSGLISSVGNVGPALLPVAFGYFIDVTGTYLVSIFLVAAIVTSIFVLGSRFWE